MQWNACNDCETLTLNKKSKIKQSPLKIYTIMLIPTIYTGRQNGWLPSLFSELFDNDSLLNSTTFGTSPAINVSEDSKGYKVEVAAPGMTKDDFAVSLAPDDTLIISMEKKTGDVPEKGEEKQYLRREFSYSKFEQRLSLPDGADREHIDASMSDGVLTISIPKLPVEEKCETTRCIEIR